MQFPHPHCSFLHKFNTDEVGLGTVWSSGVRIFCDLGIKKKYIYIYIIIIFCSLTANMCHWSYHAAAPPQTQACRRRETTRPGCWSLVPALAAPWRWKVPWFYCLRVGVTCMQHVQAVQCARRAGAMRIYVYIIICAHRTWSWSRLRCMLVLYVYAASCKLQQFNFR